MFEDIVDRFITKRLIKDSDQDNHGFIGITEVKFTCQRNNKLLAFP